MLKKVVNVHDNVYTVLLMETYVIKPSDEQFDGGSYNVNKCRLLTTVRRIISMY